MVRSFPKKILAIVISFALLMTLLCVNLVFADTVVVGVAPSSGTKTMSQNANTPYLQNQYSGPGILPNSSITNSTPIQGVSIDQSVGQQVAAVDNNGIAYTGPTTHTISSPAAHNIALASANSNSAVIANGALDSRVTSSNTSDTGPTFFEITSPSANNDLTSTNYGPGAQSNNNPQEIPEYTTYQTTSQNTVADGGVIIYSVNDNIQAVKPNVVAPAAVVVNATTRQIYFSKGGFNAYRPASLANLVTASLLLTYKGLNDPLVVSATAVSGLESGASTAKLKAGDTILVRDALLAMFVGSCCDVANVVAENVAGNIPNFVALMNQTVKNWGCVGTNFMNPSGLNNDAQLTNTYDMAIIMDKVSSDPNLKILLQQPACVLPASSGRGNLNLYTKNQLLMPGNKNYYAGISASRMGYTSKSKYTIASELDYNGQRLIAIVLNANGSQWDDTTRLLNYAKVASIEVAMMGGTTNYNTVLNVANTASANAMAAANINAMAANAFAASVAQQVFGTSSAALQISNGDTVGTWQKDNKGWYFIKANGQSASNEWVKQNGKVYCIDSNGYMITGWRQMSNGAMYYFDPGTGEMRHGTWVNVSTGAYYLQDDGTLAKASAGSTRNITTSVGIYTIDENGKAIAKIS